MRLHLAERIARRLARGEDAELRRVWGHGFEALAARYHPSEMMPAVIDGLGIRGDRRRLPDRAHHAALPASRAAISSST
jgi:hypothetical protein